MPSRSTDVMATATAPRRANRKASLKPHEKLRRSIGDERRESDSARVTPSSYHSALKRERRDDIDGHAKREDIRTAVLSLDGMG